MQLNGTVIYNDAKGRYDGFINGKIVSWSASRQHVESKVLSLGASIPEDQLQTKVVAEKVNSEFSITQRFEFVSKMVTMVSKKTIASAIITGQGGLGKTHTVTKALKKQNMIDVSDLSKFEEGTRLNSAKSYRFIKGYSSAKGLYRTLFEGNGMTLIFDDCDSVLEDSKALNLLKGALDSYGERYISWNADMKDEDLPRSFLFTGSVIFISNMMPEQIDQAVRSRAMCVDVGMTDAQKIERMECILLDDDFMPEYSLECKMDALDFITSVADKIDNLSLRSLISTVKIRAEDDGGDWKNLAKYVLTAGA
jgi:hypothetical protein